MAADIIIRRVTGSESSPIYTNIKNSDTAANAVDIHQSSIPSSQYPVKIPTSGTNYSYWVVTRLYANTPPSGTINNIKWYTDGTDNLGIGISCVVTTASTYYQATGTLNNTGMELNTINYPSIKNTGINCFSYTHSNPLSIDGSISYPDYGDVGEYVVFQIRVTSNAIPGPSNLEQFSWNYDET